MTDRHKTIIRQMIKDGARVYYYYLDGRIDVVLNEKREFLNFKFFKELEDAGEIKFVRKNIWTRDYDKCQIYKKP